MLSHDNEVANGRILERRMGFAACHLFATASSRYNDADENGRPGLVSLVTIGSGQRGNARLGSERRRDTFRQPFIVE
jgi:hypothetical protein